MNTELMEKIKTYHEKWGHLMSPLFFVSGFTLDIFTLGRIDDLSNILIFLVYLSVSLGVMTLDLFYDDLTFLREKNKYAALFVEYKDEIFHFAQGALLSAFTLFYFKSAQLSSSLLFMGLLLIPLVINELEIARKLGLFIKTYFINLTLMSFVLVYTPLPFGQVGLFIFIVGLIVYIAISFTLAYTFMRKGLEKNRVIKYWVTPGLIIAGLFFGLRLFKAIPPVPLSLESAGIYHNVVKEYPQYKLYHQKKWWRFWHTSDEVFHARANDTVYFFGRVFAPRGFKDKIYVRWSVYQEGKWKNSDRIPLTISGGRDKGFRGYTYKKNYQPGLWRVHVETSGGLEIGRLSFEILDDTSSQERKFVEVIDS